MKGVIRIGDKTTGGGEVLSGSSKMKFKGIGAARLNDLVSCPIDGHSPSYISQGHPTMKDRGSPLAFHDYECSCGCKLISSLNDATTSK